MALVMNETMPKMLFPGGRSDSLHRRSFHGSLSHPKARQGSRRRTHGSVGSRRRNRENAVDWKEGVDDFNLPWLFDPTRNDHLPLEQQLKMYVKRDLHKGKLFNIGTRLWPNEERCRKRVINVTGGYCTRSAPVSKGSLDGFHAPPHVLTTGPLRPSKPRVVEPDPKDVAKKLEETKMEEHKSWVEERKKFRQQLDGLGLSEEYLRRKPNKTLMESRVLREMVAKRTAQPPPPPPEEEPPLMAILPSESPIIRRPSPIAIRIIEKFLRQKKLRLVDLFSVVDKDKNWLITRDDFRKAIQQAKIPISEVLLEDLVLTLDTDLDDVLDYRDLAQGMGLWKAEKWETKRKQIAHAAAADDQGKQFLLSGLEKPDTQDYDSQEGSLPTDPHQPPPAPPPKGRTSRIKSALSALSSRSSPFLEPPEPDLRPEQMILSSEEAMVDLRKRDREALPRNLDAKKKQMNLRKQFTRTGRVGKPQPPKRQTSSNEPDELCAIIKTGDTGVDNHFARSTLGDTACMKLNKFRQAVFNEYIELCKMCERAEIPLTEEVLRRALLYPPDQPHNKIKKRIRQPESLISRESFVVSSRRNSSVSGPGGSTSKRRYSYNNSAPAAGPGSRRSRRASGDYDASSRVVSQKDTIGLYPPAECVTKAPQKMHLSTGKAYVGSKVQCWMTFEDYEAMIGKLVNGYTPLPGRCKEGAFWPGYMLDKLRLHMPNEKRDTKGAVFHRTNRQGRRQNYGYDNDLKMWPFEAGGCIQYGEIKPYYQ